MKTKRKSAPRKNKVEVNFTPARRRGGAVAPVIELAPIKLRIRKILVPVDFSEPSTQAVHYARAFADQFGSQVTLLHVVEPMLYPAELGYVPLATPDLDEQRMGEMKKRLDQIGAVLRKSAKVETMLRLGRSWREICDVAKSGEYDLLILSTHGYTGIKHALLGSTAERVVRHAPCPVLTVRSDEHDFA